MNLQAVVFDMDDTLLRTDRTVSEYTVAVLRRAAALGVHVIPASGRAAGSLQPYLRRLDCADMYIAFNGAEVCAADGTVLYRNALPADVAAEMAAYAEECGVYCHGYDEKGFFANRDSGFRRDYMKFAFLDGRIVPDMKEELAHTETCKLLVAAEPDVIARMLKEASARFSDRAAVTCSKPYYLEINAKGATKGNALRFAASCGGFRLEQTAAFGDSLNDVSMLQTAGVGVAMRNAREDVRSQADQICLSNDEDGVARFVEQLLAAEYGEVHA